MRVEINNLDDEAFNSDVHEFVMGYTTDPNHINASLQLWVGEIPDYANSLQAAFLVVEKLRLTNRLFSIVNTLEGDWNLSILHFSVTANCWEPLVTVNNVSLPRAICEATLNLMQLQDL